jgi:hypothetical protein
MDCRVTPLSRRPGNDEPVCAAEDQTLVSRIGAAAGSRRTREHAMAKHPPAVQRTLHVKFRFPAAEPAQLYALTRAATPFYEALGGRRVRLMQNVDDPTSFIQVIDYDVPTELELNRARIAGEPRLQAFLQSWRAMTGGAVEVDVFREVKEKG